MAGNLGSGKTVTRLSIDAVLPSFAAGGAERVVLSFLTGLNADRFDPRLLVLDASGPLASKAAAVPNQVDFNGLRLRQALPALVRSVRARRPSILFSSQVHVNLALLACKPLLGETRVVVREANMPSLCLASGHWPRWYGWAYGWLLRKARMVIATSAAMADEIRSDFGVDPDRITVLPNPVDTETIRSASLSPVRREGPGRRFVSVGRLVRQKGFDRLLEWMVQTGPDDHLTLIGDGPLRESLQDEARRLGIERKIHFAGFQAVPWPMVAGADALLMSSRWEGLPNAALEALAVGTPVVATAESGGIRDIADRAAGAVTVASTEAEFVNAMNEVKKKATETLRPSLLPEMYERAACIERFESIMAEIS